MSKKVFYSFHYKPDNWRAAQVRNMGVIEGNEPTKDNDWETITRGGNAAIEKWIDGQMYGKSCVVVLIGTNTANRKWINYEIVKGWNTSKGVLGIYIHNLKDNAAECATKGANPFDYIGLKDGTKLSRYVHTYDPPSSDSTKAYSYIKNNLSAWVDAAIAARKP